MRRGEIVTAVEAPMRGYIGTAMVIEAIDRPFLRVYILDWERSQTLDMRETKIVTLSRDMVTGTLLNTLHQYEKADHAPAKPAKPDLPVPAKGCELWEVIPRGDFCLYVIRLGDTPRTLDLTLSDIIYDKRWTGGAWWWFPEAKQWHRSDNGRLRCDLKPPDYVEMKVNA